MENNQMQKADNTGLILLKSSKETPKQYWITLQVTTANQAINSNSVQISTLKKQENGEIIAKAFIAFVVTELVTSFNVGKTMNDMQIGFAVNGIQSDYYFLKIDELKYCFDQAKKGRYGTMYDRIDAAVIFEWIEKYLEERIDLVIKQQAEESKKFKSDAQIHPKVAEQLKNIFSEKQIQKPIISEVLKRERTKDEIFIQDQFVLFDKLHREKPYDPEERMKTIFYLGLNLSQSEFVQFRIEEELEERNKTK
jgi:hypothetical protein